MRSTSRNAGATPAAGHGAGSRFTRDHLIGLGIVLAVGAGLPGLALMIMAMPAFSVAGASLLTLGGVAGIAVVLGRRGARDAGGRRAERHLLRADYSMRRLLALLMISAALPLALLLTYHMQREAAAEIEKAGLLVSGLAQVVAVQSAAALAESERVARYLAERPQVRALDPARCDVYLEELLNLNRQFVNITTVDATGNVVCSALKSALAAPPQVGNAPWFRRLVESRGYVIGSPQRGLFSGRLIAPTGYPIRATDGEVIGAAGVAINLAVFEPIVAAALPEGGVAVVIDGDGVVIARSEDASQYVGKNIRNTGVGRAIFERRLRGEINVGGDGVERYYAYQPIERSGWTAVVGVSTDVIHAEARRDALTNGLIGLAILLSSALLVLVIHRRIAAPMRALVGASRRVADGQLDQRAPEYGPLEVVEVAAGFNRMLDTIPLIEGELRRSEEQYRTLFDASPDAIRVICDEIVVLINPAGLRLFGAASRDDIIGRPVLESTHPDFQEMVREDIRAATVEKRAVVRAAQLLVLADGTNVEVEAATLPFAYRGKPAALNTLRDQRERLAAERAIQRLNAELESRVQARTAELYRANQSLEAFGYTVAHDLRAPLRSIAGFAALIRENYADKLGNDGEQMLARVTAGVDNMNHLIDGLLAMARLERVELAFSDVDLSALARASVAELRQRDPARSVEVVVVAEMRAVADQRLIRNVIDNLIGNAWKFTAAGENARIEFGSVAHADGLAYFVRDNGAGFESQYAGKLFNTFHRLHAADEFPGTGIGLASVKRIVEHHGGKVWAEGAVGQGACFYFTLATGPSPAEPSAQST